MAIDLVFKVPQFLRNLIGIEKGARHFKFDFETFLGGAAPL